MGKTLCPLSFAMCKEKDWKEAVLQIYAFGSSRKVISNILEELEDSHGEAARKRFPPANWRWFRSCRSRILMFGDPRLHVLFLVILISGTCSLWAPRFCSNIRISYPIYIFRPRRFVTSDTSANRAQSSGTERKNHIITVSQSIFCVNIYSWWEIHVRVTSEMLQQQAESLNRIYLCDVVS